MDIENTLVEKGESPAISNNIKVAPGKLRLVASTLIAAASLGVMITGFVQAYSYDDTLSTTGAPPVAAMSGLFGIFLFLEVIATMKLTRAQTIASTFVYRAFVYVSAMFCGFLSMAFYAAPITVYESLACFGCALWVFQAIVGATYLAKVRYVIREQKMERSQGDQLRHCCGVGCCTKAGCGMCCRWTLWTFLFLFFVQACCILSDDMTYLRQGAGTDGVPPTLVKVTSVTGKTSMLAIFCSGTQAPNDPVVLLEAGGGSGMSGMIPLHKNLTKTYGVRVCSYDRPGYGYSQTSTPYGTLDNNQFLLMQALTYLGEKGPYVCAGHSAGGTECRKFLRAYPANVTGLVFLDAYCNTGSCNIEQVWNQAMGLPTNTYDSTKAFRLSLVDAMRYLTPFVVIRAFLSKPGMEASNYGGNIAWNTQYLDFRPSKVDAEVQPIIETLWYTPKIAGDVPLLIATAGAIDQTCEEKGLVDNQWGKGCTNLYSRQNATISEIEKYKATTNSSSVASVDCHSCDHGFVQTRPGLAASYVMRVVNAVRTGGPI